MLHDGSHCTNFASLKKETKMKLMRLSVRIPLGLTIADLWIAASVILIGITIGSALGSKGINKRS